MTRAAYLAATSLLWIIAAQVVCGQAARPNVSSSPAAQAKPAAVPQKLESQEQSGLENPWDVRNILTNLSKDTTQLGPVLNQLNPQQWSNQSGAPTTYILLLQTAQRQLNDLTVSTQALSQKTESLPLALDLYFRLEALDLTARSLAEGARKYADRPTAEKLTQLLARNFDNRQRLRDYMKDLATSAEQNFRIADEEAQRCRGMISKEPSPKKSRN